MDNIGSTSSHNAGLIPCWCGEPLTSDHRCKQNPLGQSPWDALVGRVESLKEDRDAIEARLEYIEEKVQKLQDGPQRHPSPLPPRTGAHRAGWEFLEQVTPSPEPFGSPPGKEDIDRVAWECPKCGAINAPHVDRCNCSPLARETPATAWGG